MPDTFQYDVFLSHSSSDKPIVRALAEHQPFDSVLIVGFGGPGGPADVGPFLANVLRGRRVPEHRLDEVAVNYMRFGGVSPLTEVTRRQAAGLERRLAEMGLHLPVYVGMRNWHPFLPDTLRQMSDARLSRAIGFIAAAHHSYSSCQQYKENVRDARREIVREGHADVGITYVDSWYEHPLFVETITRHTQAAIAQLPPELQPTARIIFTAHSLPISAAKQCKYVEQLTATARLVASQLGRQEWTLVYQSRSGLPTDPWLGPDIREYLKAEALAGKPPVAQGQGDPSLALRALTAAVIVPIGFICDHIEVLFDLDTQAAELCRELDVRMVRAATPGDDPLFVEMMADVVKRTYERYRKYPPLAIV